MRDWTVEHNGHFAWFQRAFMVGDFSPGREAAPFYAVGSDDRDFDPQLPPKCGTCGEVPKTDELIVVETKSGDAHFLAPFRKGLQKWPRPTDHSTCWYCNTAGNGAAESTPPLCRQCADHLAGR